MAIGLAENVLAGAACSVGTQNLSGSMVFAVVATTAQSQNGC